MAGRYSTKGTLMRYYSNEHLWIDIEESNATIGICTHFLIRNSGISYISAGETGTELESGELWLTLETDKSTTVFSAPIAGIITEMNKTIIDTPALLDNLIENDCWICRIAIKSIPYSSLMTREEYDTFIG